MTVEEQKALFEEMLRALELLGKCSYRYHHLALELFGDSLGEDS